MLSTCYHCHAKLGTNDALEALPIGRRIAYDGERGRVWVICAKCARWNLTPFEERWEALEQAERLYRGTRARVSTDNIALARVADGAELVRIGRPLAPEFAHWRFGEAMRRRRWFGWLRALASVPTGPSLTSTLTLRMTMAARVPSSAHGAVLELSYADVASATLVSGDDAPRLAVPAHFIRYTDPVAAQRAHARKERDASVPLVLDTADVAPALRVLLPIINAASGSALDVRDALRWLASTARDASSRPVRAGTAATSDQAEGVAHDAVTPIELALNALASERSVPYDALMTNAGLPLPEHTLGGRPSGALLGVEMALAEEDERRFLLGELGELYARWQHAEQVARIADRLSTALGDETRTPARE